MNFWISLFLYFGIFLDFWLYLGNEKSYWRSTVVKTTGFFQGFPISKKDDFLDFFISVFFFISGHISETKRATGDPLVSKRPDFFRAFQIPAWAKRPEGPLSKSWGPDFQFSTFFLQGGTVIANTWNQMTPEPLTKLYFFCNAGCQRNFKTVF